MRRLLTALFLILSMLSHGSMSAAVPHVHAAFEQPASELGLGQDIHSHEHMNSTHEHINQSLDGVSTDEIEDAHSEAHRLGNHVHLSADTIRSPSFAVRDVDVKLPRKIPTNDPFQPSMEVAPLPEPPSA